MDLVVGGSNFPATDVDADADTVILLLVFMSLLLFVVLLFARSLLLLLLLLFLLIPLPTMTPFFAGVSAAVRGRCCCVHKAAILTCSSTVNANSAANAGDRRAILTRKWTRIARAR